MEHRTFNVNELFPELERNGRRHRWYFHYTTLDVMDKILANGMLFLSRVGKMNDGKEADTMPDNIFAACFSASGTESVAMWNTYGIPRRDAVRLCFDGCLVRKFLDGKFGVLKCHARNKDGIVIDEIPPEKVELKMFDVIYASTGEKHFQYREKHCTVTDGKGKSLNLLGGQICRICQDVWLELRTRSSPSADIEERLRRSRHRESLHRFQRRCQMLKKQQANI